MVVELDPVADYSAGVLQGFEAVSMRALLLDRADDALDHAVLLLAVRRDELLAQAVALDQARVVAAGEHQAVIRAQQERRRDAAERAVASEPPRLSRRLQLLRGWSNDKADEVFPGSAGAGGSDGAHASARAPFTVGGDLFDRGEDRLYWRDLARLGEAV